MFSLSIDEPSILRWLWPVADGTFSDNFQCRRNFSSMFQTSLPDKKTMFKSIPKPIVTKILRKLPGVQMITKPNYKQVHCKKEDRPTGTPLGLHTGSICSI